VRVHAEIFEARIADGAVHYEEEKIAIARGEPNERVRAWMRRHQRDVPDRRLVIHSTSWRYEHGHFVLTYLAFSDDFTFEGRRVPLRRLPPATKGTKSRLGILSHALRHLAFLAAEDPRPYRRALDRATRRELAKLEPAVAGQERSR
jgi:hypothetical protein